jgi:Flp pilus assembly protein TadD
MSRTCILALLLSAVFSMRLEAQTSFPPSSPSKPRAAAAPVEVPDALQEAEALLQKQQYPQAEEKLQAQATSQTKNPQFWFDLAFAQSHQGKTQDAIAAYRKAVELAPGWFEANLNLGVDLVRSGDSAAAVPVLRHAIELTPTSGTQQESVKSWVSLGQAWESLGRALESSDPKGSAEAYDRAAAFNSINPELVARAGTMLQKSGDTAGAEQHYQQAAAQGSTSGMTQLIDLLIAQKRYADADAWLRKYADQNPQDARARVQLGHLLAAEGKTAEAIATLQPLSGPGANPDVNRALAELYLDNKQYAEAAPLLQQVLEKNQADPQLHMDLGTALLHQFKYADAETELIKAIQLKPGLTAAYFDLAYAAQQNKHYELSIRVLDARAKLQPETPGTYWLRATSYDNLHAFKPAAENYKLFLAASGGKSPDQEFEARHRLKAIEH